MSVTVPEAAGALGVDVQQVRALIRRGDLRARRVSGRYLIEDADLAGVAARRPVRPMDERMATALLAALDGEDQSRGLGPTERRRLAQRLQRLRTDVDPVGLLASWLAARPAAVLRMSAAPADVPEVAVDPRVRASGPSDPRSGLVRSAAEFTGWVAAADVETLVRERFLVDVPPANVTLLVSEVGLPDGPLPLSWVIADLARLPGPRERGQAEHLLGAALREAR